MNQHRAEGKEHFLNQILRNMEVPGSDLDFSETISELDYGALHGPTSARMEMEVTQISLPTVH